MRAVMVLLLAGCNWGGGTDPDACTIGAVRDPGPGCTLPDTPDFGDPRVATITACGGGCTDGEVVAFQAIRHGTQSLSFHLITQGAPDRSGARYYFVNLFGLGRTQRWLFFVVAPSGTRLMLGDPAVGFEVYGVSFDANFVDDGLQVEIPTDALPFAGTSGATAGSGDVANWYEGAADTVCWDPSLPRGCMVF